MKKNIMKTTLALFALAATTGCGGNSFSMGTMTNQFKQESSVNNKVDIIWVVDSSLTMATHQTNLANNFASFINQFVDKGFDFHIVVTSTDAWVREVNYNYDSWCGANPNPSHDPVLSYISSADCHSTHATWGDLTYFRDGDIYGTSAGVAGARSGNYMITSAMNTTDIIQDFKTNVKVGTRGDGARESAFQSLRAALRRNADGSSGFGGETHTTLSQFRRSDAFLAVVVVSDEEDQSLKVNGSAYASIEEYKTEFLTFLDGYTGSTEGNRKYNVSGIIVDDVSVCASLHPQATQGDRYVAIAGAANGAVGNICDAGFATHLNSIAQKIITMASRFKVSREPDAETLRITVDGATIPQDDANGWSYVNENGNHYIQFNGTSVPSENAVINVSFAMASAG